MHVRDRILEAALGLLADSGAHELTQPKVSKAAGVRQSHLTYYFPTRGELLQEVARYSIEKLAGQLAHGQPGAMPEAIAAGAADKRRSRVMLGLVTAADRDPKIKQRNWAARSIRPASRQRSSSAAAPSAIRSSIASCLNPRSR